MLQYYRFYFPYFPFALNSALLEDTPTTKSAMLKRLIYLVLIRSCLKRLIFSPVTSLCTWIIQKGRVMEFRVLRWETLYMREQINEQIWWFACMTETRKWRFSTMLLLPSLPEQQPKTQRVYDARGRYGVLGFIYYAERLAMTRMFFIFLANWFCMFWMWLKTLVFAFCP